MFDGIKNFWKGVIERMFGYTTLKNIVGKDITLSDTMITAINNWKNMMNGQADWITDYIKSLKIEDGICREFSDAVLIEMESKVSEERLDKIYQKTIADLNENLQEGLGLGSLVIKPIGPDRAEFITADKFIPISFDDDGKPVDIGFLTVKRMGENDYFIRYLLASEGNEDILENIVNSVLEDLGFEEVHNLHIINPHNLPENINLKESVLDVKAITKSNKKIIIEIQLSGNIDFLKRIYYYISRNIVSEVDEKEPYDIISEVISINFVNFNMDFNDEGKPHRCFKLIDIENPNIVLDMVQMHILEVPRFKNILSNK